MIYLLQGLGKGVNAYTLLYADDYTEVAGLYSLHKGNYGTIIHEFGHVLENIYMIISTIIASIPITIIFILFINSSNIKSNGTGIFNFIGPFNSHTKIENLNIENITVIGNKKDYLGGLANVAENILLKSILVTSL